MYHDELITDQLHKKNVHKNLKRTAGHANFRIRLLEPVDNNVTCVRADGILR